MAVSKCPKCDYTTFEMEESKVVGSEYKIMLVQCARCGAVVGTQDFFNAPDLIIKLAEKLKIDLFS